MQPKKTSKREFSKTKLEQKFETRLLKKDFWGRNLTQEFWTKKLERGIVKHKIRNKNVPTCT